MSLDVATLRLDGDTWIAKSRDWPLPGEPDAGAGRALPALDLGRWARDCRFASGPGWLTVSFAPRDPSKGVGCRVMAQAWAGAVALKEAAGASKLAIIARGGYTEVRGLLTLQVLADARWRSEVLDQTEVVLLAPDRMTPVEYEAAAVEHVVKSMPGWESVDPGSLRMPKVRSEPDGLLTHASSGRIVIVEAKDRPVTFEEGASQLFQYAAQARWALTCPSGNVRFVLVTSDATAERKLEEWRALMRQACPTTIVVPEECLKHVHLT